MANEVTSLNLGSADDIQRTPEHLPLLGVLRDAIVARGQLPEVGLQGSLLYSPDICLLSGIGWCKELFHSLNQKEKKWEEKNVIQI